MPHDQLKTSLSALARDACAATPRERLQAAVAVLLDFGDIRALLTLGVDPWRLGECSAEMVARARMQALRLLLSLVVPERAEQQVVDLIRAELPAVLQLLDEQAEQLRGAVVGGIDAGAAAEVAVAQGVEAAAAGRQAVVLAGLLAQDLFSVHGDAPVARESGEQEVSSGLVCGMPPVSAAAGGHVDPNVLRGFV